MAQQIDRLFSELKPTPEGAFFNPWYDRDLAHDRTQEAPEIRRLQLRAYLEERLDSAKYLFIAEALGYQGGHFTGIAMTSERILLGHHYSKHGIPAEGVFQSIPPQRTSKPEVNRQGMTEPTATIMWKAIHNLGIDPYQTVLWNALAWHPYDSKKGLLSNRTPTDRELELGTPALNAFLQLFPDQRIIAVGKKSEQCLDGTGVSYTGVRHPANGGAPKFRRQVRDLISE